MLFYYIITELIPLPSRWYVLFMVQKLLAISKRIFTTRGAIDTMRYTDCNAKDVGISIFLENTLFGILFGLIIYVFKESFDTAKMI